MLRWGIEAAGLLGTRTVLGDERTARLLGWCPHHVGFADRHANQLGGILAAYLEGEDPC